MGFHYEDEIARQELEIERLSKTIDRLRAALEIIAGGYWGRMDVQEYARKALANEQEAT